MSNEVLSRTSTFVQPTFTHPTPQQPFEGALGRAMALQLVRRTFHDWKINSLEAFSSAPLKATLPRHESLHSSILLPLALFMLSSRVRPLCVPVYLTFQFSAKTTQFNFFPRR